MKIIYNEIWSVDVAKNAITIEHTDLGTVIRREYMTYVDQDIVSANVNTVHPYINFMLKGGNSWSLKFEDDNVAVLDMFDADEEHLESIGAWDCMEEHLEHDSVQVCPGCGSHNIDSAFYCGINDMKSVGDHTGAHFTCTRCGLDFNDPTVVARVDFEEPTKAEVW